MAKDFNEILENHIKKGSTSGSLLRAFRKSLDLSHNDIVNITDLQRPNISALENDKIPMTSHYAEIFATVFGIHPTTLLYPDGKFHKTESLVEIEEKAKKTIEKKRA